LKLDPRHPLIKRHWDEIRQRKSAPARVSAK
jgi:hypothetical protein